MDSDHPERVLGQPGQMDIAYKQSKPSVVPEIVGGEERCVLRNYLVLPF